MQNVLSKIYEFTEGQQDHMDQSLKPADEERAWTAARWGLKRKEGDEGDAGIFLSVMYNYYIMCINVVWIMYQDSS